MSKADGTIVIDTAIETAGLTAGTKELELACKRAAQSVGDIGSKAQVSLSKALNAVTQQNKAYRAQEERVNALKAKLEEMSTQQVETPEFSALNTEIEKLTAQMAKADAKKARFMATGGSESSSVFKKMEYDADLLVQELDRAIEKKNELAASGEAYTTPDTSGVAAALAAEQEKLGSANSRLNTAFANLISRVSEYKSAANTAGSASKKLGSAMAGGLKTMLKYGLGVRTVYTLVNRLRAALKEGFSNLAQYDSSTNSAISSVSSALLQLKNSLATAFTPILQVVAPILTRFINLLSTAANYVAMFFAALSGKSTYTKATAAQKDYAASLNNTAAAAKSAKEAQQQLSGLDEMNTWQSQKDSGGASGGGGGGGGVSVGDMFEEVDIPSEFLAKVEQIKAALQFILPLVGLIAAGFLGWKISQMFLTGLSLTSLAVGLLVLGIGLLVYGLYDWITTGELSTETFYVLEAGILAAGIALAILLGWPALIVAAIVGLVLAIYKYWDDIKGFFIGLWESVKEIFTEAWDSIKQYFSDWWDRVSKVCSEAWTNFTNNIKKFVQKIKDIWSSIKTFFSNLWNGIKTGVTNIWTSIKTWLSNTVTNIKNKVVNVFTTLKTKVGDIFDKLKEVIKKPINAIIGFINGLISGIVTGINKVIGALNKLHFDIPDWVPVLGGKTFGFNIGTITAPQIPLLATGAVIPPNAPFTAVLGDQRNGRNLETPENLLRQIVREESGNGGSYRFVAQLNRRTLFDEMINEAKLRQSSTGKNPFSMA